tara:strand:- start:289 stop:879 length:591 start_codon:yes stop_codon:yes gene_type:complete
MGPYEKLILEDVRTWSKEFLEIPNVHLNRMPACPYARQAWRDNKVWIEIRDPDQGYRRQLLNLVKKIDYTKKEILIFCDPYFKEYGLNRFQKIIDSFNDKWNIHDHYFMGFHPNNPASEEEQEFLVNPQGDDVEMPESKIAYSMMLIQKFSQLYEASDRLKRVGYYKKWPKEYYNEVVDSRQKTYKKLFLKGAKNG